MVRGREYFSVGRFSSLVRSQVTVGMVDHPDNGSQLPRSTTVHLCVFVASCSIQYLAFRPYRIVAYGFMVKKRYHAYLEAERLSRY